ncbi:MAG: thioredoxin family protein [Acidobacteria bacterium]|nr:thioredoxin family protein [Acidobacteriota bacterium]
MALTESTQLLQIGAEAPDFTLADTNGIPVSPSDFAGKPLLVAFICNHCPYVKHLADAFSAFTREYQAKGLSVVGINSNDVEAFPEDSPAEMRAEAARRGYSFPYLYDETQAVAKAYSAACTPDFFLFDASHRLLDRGRFDGTRPSKLGPGVYDSTQSPPTGEDLRAAADAVLAGVPPLSPQRPSMGCNIKWKPGNEPPYYG